MDELSPLPTQAMLLRLLGASAAALVLAFAPDPAPAPDVVTTTTASGHTLVIEYIDSSGPYRRAKVSVRSERNARTPWSGRLLAMHLEGLSPLSGRAREAFAAEGYRQTAEFLSSGHTTGSSILAPAPETLKRMWFRGERGSAVSFRIPTASHNPSTQDDDDKEPEDPKEPGDGENPEDGDGGNDGDDDEATCTGAASCVGLFNPWTCTCEPDIGDPWGRGPSSDGPTTQVGF